MFRPNLCIFPCPFVEKEIAALLLNRNTEAERFLGGFTCILEHFLAALHQMIFSKRVGEQKHKKQVSQLFGHYFV